MPDPSPKPPAPRPAADARASDWFYDELMTAQPEATREFFRAQLLRQRGSAAPMRAGDPAAGSRRSPKPAP